MSAPGPLARPSADLCRPQAHDEGCEVAVGYDSFAAVKRVGIDCGGTPDQVSLYCAIETAISTARSRRPSAQLSDSSALSGPIPSANDDAEERRRKACSEAVHGSLHGATSGPQTALHLPTQGDSTGSKVGVALQWPKDNHRHNGVGGTRTFPHTTGQCVSSPGPRGALHKTCEAQGFVIVECTSATLASKPLNMMLAVYDMTLPWGTLLTCTPHSYPTRGPIPIPRATWTHLSWCYS